MNYLLIGRVNVGKSSIFNLLSKQRNNIVHKEEGATRDWHKELIKGTNSYIFDTPGIIINQNNTNFIKTFFYKLLESKIHCFLYVIEYKNGFNEVDNFSINQLRKHNKDIIIIINKFDHYKVQPNNEFDKYGISSIHYISCAHNFGIKNLKSIFVKNNSITKIKNENDLSIAIFGKPNSGKSTLLNTLVGYQRSQTSPLAGTTSDFVTDFINYKNRKIRFIDTAGIGRKSNIKNNSINYLSVKKSFENLYNVDFSIVLIDAYQGLDRQDKRIIKLVSDKSKSVLVIFNKIDLIENKLAYKSNTILNIKSTLSEIKNIKFFFISALLKKNSFKILDYILDQFYSINYKIPTSKLNKWLMKVIKQNQHPLIENKKVNFKYVVQVKEKPITIKIFCNYSNKLQNSYKTYLSNNFNYHFKILNQKTKFIFSSSKNPYI